MSYQKNSKNSCHFIGHLGADVETKTLENDNKVSKFSLATTEAFKNKEGEKTNTTTWVPCEVWGDSVDAKYHTSKSGEGDEAKYFHAFRVDEIILLGKGEESLIT